MRDDPGSYVLCAYLANTSRQAPAEVFALPVAVRANAATLTISAPARSHPGSDVPVTLVGATELARSLYAKSKPVSAGPCGASRAADLSSKSFAFFEPASGTFSVPRVTGPFRDEGRYTLCAWLQESGTDAVAEASASAVIDVLAPIPIMSSLDMLPSTFATQSRGGFTTDGLPAAGISFRLTNTPARVRFTVAARRTGRRVGSSCDKPTRSNRRRAQCWRYPLVPGSYTYDAGQGTNYLRFSGRIGARRLGPGTYRLLVSARTTTGRGKTLRHTFHIVRSR